jgi:hypothetical protein
MYKESMGENDDTRDFIVVLARPQGLWWPN